MRKRLRDKKKRLRVGGGGGGTVNEREPDREREQASEEARGRVLFYFVPCSHFSARFLTGPRCSLSKPPPPNSSLSSWLSPMARGCRCPKPRDSPGLEKHRCLCVWDQKGAPGTPQHPAQPATQALPGRSCWTEPSPHRSWAGCRTLGAAGVCWGQGVAQRSLSEQLQGLREVPRKK